MLSFFLPEITDRQWIDPYFRFTNSRACEYNFVNLLIWREKYQQKVTRIGETLVVQIRGSLGHSYFYPVGPGDRRYAVEALAEDAAGHGEALRFICLCAEHAEELEGFFPGRFTFAQERDSFDYLYAIEELSELVGKRFQPKRNHINRFIVEHPDWHAERITTDTLCACMDMADAWYQGHGDAAQAESFADERAALFIAAAHFTEMALDGILIRVGEQIVAFAIGQQTTQDTFNVFFEKAYADIQGAYAIVNREFARHIRTQYAGISLINREDDMGLEGLRKAKESYHPVRMEEKYYALENPARG